MLGLLLATGTLAAQKPVPGATVFDPSRVAVVKFTMTAEALKKMMATLSSGLQANHAYVPADLDYGGVTVTNIAVRLKGNSSLSAGRTQPSLKVDINYYRSDLEFDGLNKLNLHNVSTEQSHLSEYLSYGAWRAMNVPAPRTGWAEVWINGKKYGTYTSVEEFDQGFIKRNFDYKQGDLYKPEPPAGTLTWRGGSITNYQNINWELQETTEHAAFIHFVDVLNRQPVSALSQVLDLNGALTYLAGNVALGNWDAYTEMGHNYYLYENSPGRFTLLPWDMNFSQGTATTVYPPLNGMGGGGNPTAPITTKLLKEAGYKQIYLQILRSFLEGGASKQALNARIDQATNVLGSATSAATVRNLRNTLATRVDGLRSKLYQVLTNTPTPRLFINELMADNTHTRADEAGEFDDWIELYNPGAAPLDLAGMYLTDDPQDSRKWQFPTNTVIAAKGHLLLWADEKRAQGPLHLNFKLDKAGEFVALYDIDDRANMLIDAVTFGSQKTDVAEGRLPDGNGLWLPLLKPTPGAANDVTDTDHDGLPDAWELLHSLDPNSALDAEGDPDGDGISNLLEYASQTNPRAADSGFRVTGVVTAQKVLQLSWPAEAGKTYQVQSTTDLLWSQWKNIGLPTLDGFYSETLGTANPAQAKYYRLIRVE